MARKKNRPSVMGRQKYTERKQKQEAERGGSNPVQLPPGVKFLKIEEEGVKYLDLVPYEVTDPNHPVADVGDLYYKRPFQIHRNIGPDGVQLICPKTWGKGKRCAICEERAKIYTSLDGEEPDKETKKTLQALNASNRGLYVVIDRDSDELYVLEVGDWSKGGTDGFGAMLDKEIKFQDEEDKLPWDWDGPSLKVRYGKDKFRKTVFYPAEKIDLEEEGKDLNPDDLEIPDLDACLVKLSSDQVEALMQGVDIEEDEKQEEKPASRNRKPVEDPADDPEPITTGDPDALEFINDFDPDDIDYDDDEEVTTAREELLAAAAAGGLDLKGVPKTLTGKNNNTEKGINRLHKKLVERLPELPEPEPEPEPEETPADKRRRLKREAKEKAKKVKEKKGGCPEGNDIPEDDWGMDDKCTGCDKEDECLG